MKSNFLKNNKSVPIKKYIGLFIFLFLGSLLLLFDHFDEEPFQLDSLQAQNDSKFVYPAPDFRLVNLKGNWEGLADYRGSVLLLNLWATWCLPCRVEMNSFEMLYRRYRARGLTVLAVSIDKGPIETVKQFVEERQLSFPILLDQNGKVEKLYPSPTIPATFVIDKKGNVVTKVDGAKNWKTEETFEAVEFLLNGSK